MQGAPAGRRFREVRGSAASNLIIVSVVVTLILSLAIVLAGFAGSTVDTIRRGGSTPDKGDAAPDPWSTAGIGGSSVPRRSGLDGSVDVARLRSVLTPLVSTSSQSPGAEEARAPVRMGFDKTLPVVVEEGAKAGFGEIGGLGRSIPVLTGSEAFPAAAAIPLQADRLNGWGHRFKK